VNSSAPFYAVWAVLGAAAVGLWLLSHRPGATVARPLQVLARLASGPVSRILLVPVVMWLGWHLFAR
jgi:hypothetical protein